MSTIPTLKSNHDSAIRQKTIPGSLTTDNEADQLDALADEIRDRGVLQTALATDLNATNSTDYRNVIVANDGIYQWEESGTADNDTIFDAADTGVFVKRFSGSAGIEDVTYAELVALIGASDLTPGAQYRITDFATVHYIVDSSGDQHLDSIITGSTELLIVTATSSDTIDKVALSATYPQDIIHYDWNQNNWLTDQGFADISNYGYEWPPTTTTIIPDFKGVIYFRHDTIQDNFAGWDIRSVKTRRWKLDTATFVGFNPSYVSTLPSGQLYGINILTNDYIDYLTFDKTTSSLSYQFHFRCNHIMPEQDYAYYYNNIATILTGHAIICNVSGESNYNTIEPYTSAVLLKNCESNFIKQDSYKVALYNVKKCNIALIASVGSGLRNIGSINMGSLTCKFPDNVNNLIVQAEIGVIDFSSATFINGSGNKTLFKDSTGVTKLSYIDGSGVLQVVDPTT